MTEHVLPVRPPVHTPPQPNPHPVIPEHPRFVPPPVHLPVPVAPTIADPRTPPPRPVL